eukprot:m.165636 g.165636  ORF g.165636 m.165636 type:complete len:56 (+) comp16600_c0_seq4:1884-2051(+)
MISSCYLSACLLAFLTFMCMFVGHVDDDAVSSVLAKLSREQDGEVLVLGSFHRTA